MYIPLKGVIPNHPFTPRESARHIIGEDTTIAWSLVKRGEPCEKNAAKKTWHELNEMLILVHIVHRDLYIMTYIIYIIDCTSSE